MTDYEESVEGARAVARRVTAEGARVHLWSTTHAPDVSVAIEGFEAEGWMLSQFSTHFRDYKVTGGIGSIATIAYEKQMKKQGTGQRWDAVADVYVLLFRRRPAA